MRDCIALLGHILLSYEIFSPLICDSSPVGLSVPIHKLSYPNIIVIGACMKTASSALFLPISNEHLHRHVTTYER